MKLDYPPDWQGRKTYVFVDGEFVPKIYAPAIRREGRVEIMKDIGEYTSTLDGARITSRSQHREHMRQHGVIELGNEKPLSLQNLDKPPPSYDWGRALGETYADLKVRGIIND